MATRQWGLLTELQLELLAEVVNDPSSNYHTIRVRLTAALTRSGHVYLVKDLHRVERDTLEARIQAP